MIEPYYQRDGITIYNGDSCDILKELQSGSVQMCVTSPPYYGLRDYGTGEWVGGDSECSHVRESKHNDNCITGHKNNSFVGDAIYKDVCPRCSAIRIDKQFGLENTPEAYINRLVGLFREVKRVLKDNGTLWVNIGDSYASHKDCKSITDSLRKGYISEEANVIEKGRSVTRNTKMLKEQGYKDKDLIGIPWMLAFALRADGWFLRQDLIWHKPNPMPESVKDRCTKSHEYIFLLSKSKNYYYDADAIKEPIKDDSIKRLIQDIENQKGSDRVPGKTNGTMKAVSGKKAINIDKRMGINGTSFINHKNFMKENGELLHGTMANKKSVWTITTKPYKEAHFATFPEDLISPCIKAGSAKGDIVLDPFGGSGTTADVSRRLGRKCISIELNKEYCDLYLKRRGNNMELEL